MLFRRLITALFTPFTEENEIDWPCLEANIERLIDIGFQQGQSISFFSVNGVKHSTALIGGTTYHFPPL